MLIKASKAQSTWDTYKTANKQFREWCSIWDINPYIKHTDDIYSYFVTHRYSTTKNVHKTLSSCVSGVISTYNTWNPSNPINRSKYGLLAGTLAGISRQPDRQSKHTNPIRNKVLVLLIKNKYNKFSYTSHLWKTMTCFAKLYALRCSEYTTPTQVPNERTIQWKDISIRFWKGKFQLSFELKISKTNHTWKTEILTRECICDLKKYKSICAICHFRKYMRLYTMVFGPPKPYDFVFKHVNGNIVTAKDFRLEFAAALLTVGIKAKHPYWRPHSLRSGEISDMMAAGVPFEYIQKHARHTPNSKTTWTYIQVETNEDAKIINAPYIKFFLDD